jgi:phospholipid/cholesterol/gamma-HCH transport system substrate-binding protein
MKTFAERSPVIVGAVGLAAVAAVAVAATEYDKVPFFATGKTYSAYFADAGALRAGADVQVSGYDVGKVSAVGLDGSKALVTFTVADNVRLGDRTEASIKTNTLLGTKIVQVIPRGNGQLSATIPVERTRSPYQISEALGDVSKTIAGLDTDQLSNSLATLAQTFSNTAPDLRIAVTGLTRFSQTLNTRDEQLRSLLANANKVTSVLAKRVDQVVGLIGDTNALLAQLLTQSDALDWISNNLSALSKQLSGLIAENRAQLRPALDKLNGVLTIVDNRKERVKKSIKLLNMYAMSLGESVGSGPFFNAYLANLLPGQFVQPFIDAAFSDLGVDPHVLLPSQLTDPQTGQPGTPALPMPYPRTGQGGEPRLTLPDAITGKPGDQGCGPPGLPLPGPTGCYPYREPLPPGPPGGPPPGPPAPEPPGRESVPQPTPLPVYVPAPNEVAPGASPVAPLPGPGSAGGEGGAP